MMAYNYTYNMTAIKGIDSVFEMFRQVEIATKGTFFALVLLAMFAIILITLLRGQNDFTESVSVSSWAVFVLSLYPAYAKLLDLKWTLGFLVLSAFATFFMYMGKR